MTMSIVDCRLPIEGLPIADCAIDELSIGDSAIEQLSLGNCAIEQSSIGDGIAPIDNPNLTLSNRQFSILQSSIAQSSDRQSPTGNRQWVL